mmetsp:Transcript_11052/g.21849  ORF Transcript_11052/g.21849 Transcript_11052/m.21849 type:complete len:280 (-) Transcript_11052:427-1266(-)
MIFMYLPFVYIPTVVAVFLGRRRSSLALCLVHSDESSIEFQAIEFVNSNLAVFLSHGDETKSAGLVCLGIGWQVAVKDFSEFFENTLEGFSGCVERKISNVKFELFGTWCARSESFSLFQGFVHNKGAAHKVGAIEFRHGFIGRFRTHGNEAEATGLVVSHGNIQIANVPILRKVLFDLVVFGFEWKVSNVQFLLAIGSKILATSVLFLNFLLGKQFVNTHRSSVQVHLVEGIYGGSDHIFGCNVNETKSLRCWHASIVESILVRWHCNINDRNALFGK